MDSKRSENSIGLQAGVELRSTLEQPSVGQAVETFLRLGLVGKSPKTEAWYRRRLSGLAAALGGDAPAVSVMESDLVEWYAGQAGRTHRWGGASTHPQAQGRLSPCYLHSLVRAAKKFFKWLHEEGILPADPALGLAFPRLPRAGRKGIADGDLSKILALAQRGDDPQMRARDYALLRFLESTGARLGGVANLLVEDLALDEPEPRCRRAIVREKFDEERAVYMTSSALSAVQAWLAVRPDAAPGTAGEHVFLGKTNGGGWLPLGESGIYQVAKRYALLAGVKKNWSPHQWRHRYGRLLAQQGMSLGVIAQLMGHKSVSVTALYYGQFADDERLREYDRHMPDLGG